MLQVQSLPTTGKKRDWIYSDGDELRDAGTYKVVTSDEYGNTNEYTFTIEKERNIGLWILIALALLVTGGFVFFLVQRKNKI